MERRDREFKTAMALLAGFVLVGLLLLAGEGGLHAQASGLLVTR
jgi:hypothetical protein